MRALFHRGAKILPKTWDSFIYTGQKSEGLYFWKKYECNFDHLFSPYFLPYVYNTVMLLVGPCISWVIKPIIHITNNENVLKSITIFVKYEQWFVESKPMLVDSILMEKGTWHERHLIETESIKFLKYKLSMLPISKSSHCFQSTKLYIHKWMHMPRPN